MKTFERVWFVRAGPDDISLPTLKVMIRIKQADVIIYDRLVNPKILEWALPNCLLTNVGRNPGLHCIPQDEINVLLAQYTQTYNNIVRPKSGDPYIFGRGAEEVEDLVGMGILFGVVPGISSIIGGLTYVGIPVTHRDFTPRFHVVAGHAWEGSQQQDRRQLAKLNGMLVIVMGIASLVSICEGLLMDGKSADTPIALIMSVTRDNQCRLTRTFGSLLGKTQEASILPPTLIVIGDVVTLSDRFSSILETTALPENLYYGSLA